MSNHVEEYHFEEFDMEEYGRGKRPHPAVNYHEPKEDFRRLRMEAKAFENRLGDVEEWLGSLEDYEEETLGSGQEKPLGSGEERFVGEEGGRTGRGGKGSTRPYKKNYKKPSKKFASTRTPIRKSYTDHEEGKKLRQAAKDARQAIKEAEDVKDLLAQYEERKRRLAINTFEVDKLRVEKTQLEADKVRLESQIKRLNQRNKRLTALAVCLVHAVVGAAIFSSSVLLGGGHFQD